jgi:uncharacterized protein involved in cysteine biosynthesis
MFDGRPASFQTGKSMIRAFFLALRDLTDPAVVRVFVKSMIVTLIVFAALGVGVFALLDRWAGHSLSAVAATAVMILGGWLLFRVVAIAVLQLFGDEVVAAVERRAYPAAHGSARGVGLGRGLRMGLGSAGRALAANLVMLPVYLALLFTAIGPAIAFFVVNGWLLGRDLGDTVGSRHLDDAAMRGWRAATKGERFVLGLAVTGLFMVPLANLFAPILGAAMATHLFHGSRR